MVTFAQLSFLLAQKRTVLKTGCLRLVGTLGDARARILPQLPVPEWSRGQCIELDMPNFAQNLNFLFGSARFIANLFRTNES